MSAPGQKSKKGGPSQDRTNPLNYPNSYEQSVPILTIQSPLFKRQNKIAESNPGIWKKIVEAQAEHERFLEKLGFSEEKHMKSHYEEAGGSIGVLKQSVTNNDVNTPPPSSFRNQGIPWKKKDFSNPIDERKKIFDTFNRIGGNLPKSPPRGHSSTEASRSRPQTKKKLKRKAEDKKIKFNDVVTESNKPLGMPFPHTAAKVDTGLGQHRKPMQRFTANGIPIVNKTHHPLTIAPRLPENFGHHNYESFKANRAATIANVTARLHQDKSRSRPNFRRKELIKPAAFHHVPGSLGVYSDWDSNTMISPRQSIQRILKTKPSNPVQILRAPVVNAPSTSSTSNHANIKPYVNQPFAKTEVPGVANIVKQKPRVPPTPGSAGGPKRRYRPSQLMPLHIPGPKYDNIYIGRYSGSESDRDSEDNMDRAVKSRKR